MGVLIMEKEKNKISIIIPVLNEEKSLYELHSSLQEIFKNISSNYEILLIDDGSTDNSYEKMKDIFNKDKHVKIIKFRSHFGKSAALDAGFTTASGDIIITMDADLQEDPESIPNFLEALKEFDVVCGWRFKRRDPLIKKIASKIYNWLARIILKVKIHDLNCGLKAFKKEAINEIEVLGEMHRYLPALAAWKGFKVGEVKIGHSPRQFGKSKYGFTRLIKGVIDMLTVKFLISYSTRPAHVFGLLGIAFSMFGFITGLYLVVLRLFYNVWLSNRPLLLLAILLIILGVQMISFGMIAEVTSRVLYSVKQNKPYAINEILEH